MTDFSWEIALVNRSTLVTNEECEKIAQAVQIQAALHLAPAWDRIPPKVAYYADPALVPASAEPIILFDDADAPGALGYHTEGADGQPFSQIFCKPVLDNGGAVLDGGTAGVSIASVVSHEACEMFVDPEINAWIDGPTLPQGSCYALEVCDPVESTIYPVTLLDGSLVYVSNFVTPAYFDQMAPAGMRLDHVGQLQHPFHLADGGYLVIRKAPGSEIQIYGDHAPPAWKMEMKADALGRSMRRGAARTFRVDDTPVTLVKRIDPSPSTPMDPDGGDQSGNPGGI